ncbi:MAG: hypothetical protein PVJ39_21290 [Gammaproteobacteria bacterium]|jgi:hypothetical protein
MATRSAFKPLSLVEVARRQDPNGEPARIAEVLTEVNEILLDAVWQEANDTHSHKMVNRTSLPSGSWRMINRGVAVEASSTDEYWETLGMLESYAEVDVELVNSAPNPMEFRNSENNAFLEGMSQTKANTMIYGSSLTNPDRFTGLAPRLNDLSQNNVFGNGGTGVDLTSMYIVQWGPTRAFMLYPKGRKADVGITHRDLGEHTLIEGTSNELRRQIYRDHFKMKCGFAVRDPRCIARICNIETSGSTNIFDEDVLIRALNNMYMRGAGAVIYCSKTIFTQLDIRAKDKTNVFYGPEDPFGRPQMFFRRHPLRLCEAILDTESAVT